MTDGLSLACAILQIVWINLLLSGDNAILIAMACRALPEKQRRLGVALGASGAVGLRIVFTLAIGQLLNLPLLKLVGGLFVLWLAIKLPNQDADDVNVDARQSLFGAIRAIVVADAVMSLDNVLAIAAAANGSTHLIIFGLLLSAPLIFFGASAVSALMERFPLVIWTGAAALGWAGAELVASDPIWGEMGLMASPPDYLVRAIGGALVLCAALWISRANAARAHGGELAG